MLLTWMAGILARKTKSLLIGEAATPEQEGEIRSAVTADRAVEEIVYLRTLHLGPSELLVEAKVVMSEDLRVRDVALAIDRIEESIRQRVPGARIISIEPDIPRTHDPDRPRYESSDP